MEARERMRARNPAPMGAAVSASEAVGRVTEARAEASARGDALRALKSEARASERWDQSVGYKGFPEVIEANRKFELARIRWLETRLERALFVAWPEEPKLLDAFNWSYGEDFRAREGANAKSLTYILPAVLKSDAPCVDAVVEICAVALLAEVEFPAKVRLWAIETLEASMDSLDDDGRETMNALKSSPAARA